jgi:hypothetical protein
LASLLRKEPTKVSAIFETGVFVGVIYDRWSNSQQQTINLMAQWAAYRQVDPYSLMKTMAFW